MPFLTLTAASAVPIMIDWPTMRWRQADQAAVQIRFQLVDIARSTAHTLVAPLPLRSVTVITSLR